MAGGQGAQQIKELTAWLETRDAQGRPGRARRLRDLLDIFAMPPEGLSFMGGEESVSCLDEIRHCYLDGSFMAVVLLCLAYVERELAAGLYAAGWEPAEKARLAVVLEKAYEDGTLCELEWQAYRDLAGLRNSHAHFRVPGSPTSRMYRVVDENALGTEILARDAKRAVAAVAGLVKRQSGMRVGLGASEE